jgi:HAD superfamily hydrolase (TIGR01484 family)
MKSFKEFPQHLKSTIGFVLTDIDDTLTIGGRFPSIALAAMENLKDKGVCVIPITGRPAGWCDHIARMWPVDGIIGENGAFYFKYDDTAKKMVRRYFKTERDRKEDLKKLLKMKQKILRKIPGCQVSADQAYREADLAIDLCEDVPPLSKKEVDKIVTCFNEAGAQAKISSIHVNGWFGDYNKLSMTQLFFEEVFHVRLDEIKQKIIFIGDSPNDSPMFSYFPHSVGVANVLNFKERMTCNPAWITEKEGGYGFAEMVDILLW